MSVRNRAGKEEVAADGEKNGIYSKFILQIQSLGNCIPCCHILSDAKFLNPWVLRRNILILQISHSGKPVYASYLVIIIYQGKVIAKF